jgi:hypothetical protein
MIDVNHLLYSYFKINGAPERIRTSDPLIRSQVLYPAELRVRCERPSRPALALQERNLKDRGQKAQVGFRQVNHKPRTRLVRTNKIKPPTMSAH